MPWPGDMDKSEKILASQRVVPGLQELSLYDARGRPKTACVQPALATPLGAHGRNPLRQDRVSQLLRTHRVPVGNARADNQLSPLHVEPGVGFARSAAGSAHGQSLPALARLEQIAARPARRLPAGRGAARSPTAALTAIQSPSGWRRPLERGGWNFSAGPDYSGNPCASATARQTIFPFRMLMPLASAGFFWHASSTPKSARVSR